MRALFLGTANPLTARPLWEWLEAGHQVAELWLPRDLRPREWRRDRWLARLRPEWSVSAAVKKHGLRVRTTGPLRKAAALDQLASDLDVDVVVSSCFPYVVPKPMLDRYAGRAVNLHPALLPAYRGPSPIAWMLFNHDAHRRGGMTLHLMTPELDAGDIVAQRQVSWTAEGGYLQWEAELAAAAGHLVRDELLAHLQAPGQLVPQIGEARYYPLFENRQLQIDSSLKHERAAYLIGAMPIIRKVFVEANHRRVAVSAVARHLGPPTGKPLVKRLRTVELDLADARVRLTKALPNAAKYWQWRRLIHLSRTNPADLYSTRIAASQLQAA